MKRSSDLLGGGSNNCKKKSKKCKKKSKKKRYSSPEDSSSDDDTSSSSSVEVKKKHKSKKHKKKKLKEKMKKQRVELNEGKTESATTEGIIGPCIPDNLIEQSRAMAPETKEEWEKKQSLVRKVYDNQTGRHRLIKGDGEVIEEIVSKEKHNEINKQATFGDGSYFQSQLSQPKKS